ncbi:hypothetical protein ATE84_2806 [Aquimarina sp. MAR_2010_214]|nr:hypothetical protein ATE84_2806 [Aquimarina sp. MAR_2010_214]
MNLLIKAQYKSHKKLDNKGSEKTLPLEIYTKNIDILRLYPIIYMLSITHTDCFSR